MSRVISIEVNGDATVLVDGLPLANAAPDDSVRHDTPADVAIAVAAYEAARQYRRSLGDNSFLPFHQLSGADRIEAMRLVALVKAGTVTSAQQLHDGWVADQLAAGWAYGPSFDASTKANPSVQAFDKLDPQQRKYAMLFFAVVSTLLAP